MSSCVMNYAGRFTFPVAPLELWSSLEHVDEFERWWSWLGDLHLYGDGLRRGSVLHGTVAPPLPYRMEVNVELERCLPGKAIDAVVSGDLAGNATLGLEPEGPDGKATAAQVAWSLEMKQRALRVADRFAHPLLQWGHDCVVEATVAGFREHLEPLGDGRRTLARPTFRDHA